MNAASFIDAKNVFSLKCFFCYCFLQPFFFSCAVSLCFCGHGAARLGRFPSGQARGTVPFTGGWSFAVLDVLCHLAVPVPRGAADKMSSQRGTVGRDQPSSFWLCQDGYFHYTGILCWDRLHCSTFPRARKQLGVFSLAEHRDSVGSSVASPASPSPGVEGPWCQDPAPGGDTRAAAPDTAVPVAHGICAAASFRASP